MMPKIICLLISLLAIQPAFAQERGSIVTIDLRGQKVVYEAYGKQTDLDGAVEILRQRAKRTGVDPRDDTAIILASKALTVVQIQGLYSTLEAYGFLDIKLFVFDMDKSRMMGMSFAKGFPFTKDRSILMRAAGK